MRDVVERSLDLEDAALTSECERAIRNHDPCISCATHFSRSRWSGTRTRGIVEPSPPIDPAHGPLVLGLGNEYRGDDACGILVARLLRPSGRL